MATPDTLRYARIPLTHGSGVIPAVGFGTLIHDPLVAKQATKTALKVGYRHLDCAERYGTEEAVGQAMQESFGAGTIRRKDVFVTTKLWNTNHRPERVKPAFDASRRRLQIDDVDCSMIHTPFAFRPGDDQDPTDACGQVAYDSGVTLLETWQALERLVDEGRCGAIGLSDITLGTLLVPEARLWPGPLSLAQARSLCRLRLVLGRRLQPGPVRPAQADLTLSLRRVVRGLALIAGSINSSELPPQRGRQATRDWKIDPIASRPPRSRANAVRLPPTKTTVYGQALAGSKDCRLRARV